MVCVCVCVCVSVCLIAVESATNTKCEKFDCPKQIERLYDALSAVNASWLETRLRLTPQHTFDLPQTFENSGLQRAIFTYSLARNSNSSSRMRLWHCRCTRPQSILPLTYDSRGVEGRGGKSDGASRVMAVGPRGGAAKVTAPAPVPTAEGSRAARLHLVPKISLLNAINSKWGLRRLLVDT